MPAISGRRLRYVYYHHAARLQTVQCYGILLIVPCLVYV